MISRTKATGTADIIEFVNRIQNITGNKVKAIRMDGAAKYSNVKYIQFLKEYGIKKETSAPYRQSQNGFAERSIQMINNLIMAVLLESGLPKSYWGEAVFHVIDVMQFLQGNPPHLHLQTR